MDTTLLVLAAGMGSRYGGLKQLDVVGPGGETIIDYSIFDAIRTGFTKVVFVIRRDIEEAFKTAIGERYAGKIAVDYAFQELDMVPESFNIPPERKKPWGTGHAILVAKDKVSGPFAVINADDFYGRHGFELLHQTLTQKTACCMCGFILDNTLSAHGTVSRGVCALDASGQLKEVVEMTRIEKVNGKTFNHNADGSETELSGQEIVSLNMWGFMPGIFKHLEHMFSDFLAEHGKEEKSEFFIPFVVDELIQKKLIEVQVMTSRDKWFGVTYREDKDYVVKSIRALVDAGEYPPELF